MCVHVRSALNDRIACRFMGPAREGLSSVSTTSLRLLYCYCAARQHVVHPTEDPTVASPVLPCTAHSAGPAAECGEAVGAQAGSLLAGRVLYARTRTRTHAHTHQKCSFGPRDSSCHICLLTSEAGSDNRAGAASRRRCRLCALRPAPRWCAAWRLAAAAAAARAARARWAARARPPGSSQQGSSPARAARGCLTRCSARSRETQRAGCSWARLGAM